MKRYLEKPIQRLALARKKMAFVSGPRQVGKTTLAKNLSKEIDKFVYNNWDESSFRKLWAKAPNVLAEQFDLSRQNISQLLVLDEIHKSKLWKQKLKGLYDSLGEKISILVTGSARLNIFKKGSDSLMGRYFNFRLHPLSYGEIENNEIVEPEKWKAALFKNLNGSFPQQNLEKLLKLNGFPEVFLTGDEKILRIWRQSRTEKIVREDLRDLSRLPELSQIETLVSLLPERVGSPLSIQSLREDLEVSFNTAKRWLNYLQELYYYFEIKPWTKSVIRSLKKEPKIYLYDWSEIENDAIRFENLIACHLIKACHYWTDTGEGQFELHYLRNKEKEEIDFLISKNKKAWLAVEVKMNETKFSEKVLMKFQKQLQVPVVQVVFPPQHWRLVNPDALVISANRFLAHLP